MAEFLKVNFDLFKTDLSTNAVLLFSFYETRINGTSLELKGQKYILPKGKNDPKTVINMSDDIYKRSKKELINKGFIDCRYIKGSGSNKAIFLTEYGANIHNMQISTICKNPPYSGANIHHIKVQESTSPLYIKEKEKKSKRKDGEEFDKNSFVPSLEDMAEVLKKI